MSRVDPTVAAPEARAHRVCHLITSLDVGGAQLMLCRLLASRDDLRSISTVVSLTASLPIGDRFAALGVPVLSLDMPRGRPALGGLVRLIRHLRQTRPHILQTWLYHADLIGLIAARLAGTPVVLWNIRASDMDMSRYRWMSGLTLRSCARLSGWPQAVVVNSRSGQAVHARLGYRPRRWAVIPNGIDTDEFRPHPGARACIRKEFGFDADAVVIGLVARFDAMKDHRTFLMAAARLHRTHPQVRFLLAGEGVDDRNASLMELAREAGVPQERLRLLGYRRDISHVTCALDVATCCSAFGEGFPNVVAEAMACGVPTVVTDVGDARELVGQAGTVVPPRAPDALASAWAALIDRPPSERALLGEAARERICQRYSLATSALAYHELYAAYLPEEEAAW